MLNMVFVGNGNVGKTTWFNYLSGSSEKVANYVGVSVDATKTNFMHRNEIIQMIDLPGLYDLNVVSGEEVYAKQYIMEEKVDLFIFVMDARNIKKSLPLFYQIKALKIPIVIVCNFIHGNGNYVFEFLEKSNTPIFFVQRKHKDILLDILITIISSYCYVPCEMKKKDEKESIMHINTLDSFLLHPIIGIFTMILFVAGVMSFLFYIASYAMGIIEMVGQIVQSFVLQHIDSFFIESFLFSTTTLLSFLPFLVLFYGFMAFLEESGYMARIAYLLHPLLSVFHLSGNSVLPLLCGYSCSAIAIMATRTIKDEKERKRCGFLIPFLNCSGKLPLYVLFIHTFFYEHTILMFFILYGSSLLVALIISYFLAYKEKQTFLIMELPTYKMPSISILFMKIKMEIRAFIKKGWKIVLLGSLFLFFVFPYFPVEILDKMTYSLSFAQSKEALYSLPFGLLSKENLLVYFSLKATKQPLSIYISSLWKGKEILLQAFTYLLYVSMSVPCVMTISAIYSEFGFKFLCKSILLMLFVPFIVCLCVDFGVRFLSLFL